MKKVNLTSLTLNKKSVSNLQIENINGGYDRVTLTFFNGLCQCPAPTRNNASWCICK